MSIYDRNTKPSKFLIELDKKESFDRLRQPIKEGELIESLKNKGYSDEEIESFKHEIDEEVTRRKRWCERYIKYKQIFEGYCNEVEYYRVREQQLTKYLTGLPGGSGGNHTDNYWVTVLEKMDMIKQYLSDCSDKLLCTCVEVTGAINKVEDVEENLVLYLKYIENKSTKEIVKETSWSKRKVYRLLRRGLLSLDIDQVEVKPPQLMYPSDYYFHHKKVNITDIMEPIAEGEELIKSNRQSLSFLDLE